MHKRTSEKAANGRRTRRRLVPVVLAGAAVLAAGALPAQGATQVGYKAHSFAGFNVESAGGAVTGQKPESKLWFNAGSWWAAMASPAAKGAHTIWKLGSTSWSDSGVVIDTRPSSREDVLSLGNTLYILSRSSGSSSPSRLRRFTYASGKYSLASGFPVDVPGAGRETNVLARDSKGVLWITYTSGSRVYVARSQTSETAWGVPFMIPVGDSTSVSSDDISSVVSFTDATGPAIGVLWSNQNAGNDYFAVHRDGASDATWTLETALSGPIEADDHINIKTFEGRIYAVVKTSQSSSSSPLIRLLQRDASGKWSKHPVANVNEKNTRPITMLQIDSANRRIYVFMTLGEGTAARGIAYKSSSMTSIGFPSAATVFIQGPNAEVINDATSMKGNTDATTGVVVLASDGSSYWWNKLA